MYFLYEYDGCKLIWILIGMNLFAYLVSKIVLNKTKCFGQNFCITKLYWEMAVSWITINGIKSCISKQVISRFNCSRTAAVHSFWNLVLWTVCVVFLNFQYCGLHYTKRAIKFKTQFMVSLCKFGFSDSTFSDFLNFRTIWMIVKFMMKIKIMVLSSAVVMLSDAMFHHRFWSCLESMMGHYNNELPPLSNKVVHLLHCPTFNSIKRILIPVKIDLHCEIWQRNDYTNS